MSKTEGIVSWVVYQMTLPGKPVGLSAVCEQTEWDALELSRPGYHTLVRAGIANEGEAERLARGPEAPPVPRGRREPQPSPSPVPAAVAPAVSRPE